MSLNAAWADLTGRRQRLILLILCAIFFFAVLLLRLWYLQVINADRYATLSEKNRFRYLPIAAPRGTVLDRNGAVLVDNRPAFGLSALRQEVDDPEALIHGVAPLLEVSQEKLWDAWRSGSRFPRYRPVPLAHDIGRDSMERLQEHSVDLPGSFIDVLPMRSYPGEELAAHLFGYLGEITEAELTPRREAGYRPGDQIGKGGLEKSFEEVLRGEEGERLVEVDVKGRQMRQVSTQEPLPGSHLSLTLLRPLQQAAETSFGDQAGAAVVLDVHSGEILAMVSRPSFNPELFARGISGQAWIDLLKDPRHPLQFKAINGQYPPASTFKIVTALAALEAGVASSATTVDCQGSIILGNRAFRCWKKDGHGATNLKKALRESCDVWFYEVALRLGIDRLSTFALSLGLGESFGLPLEGEKRGLIPTRQWKRERYKTGWYDGETIIAAIGQGFVLATPLQLAVMTATVANGGTVYKPQVVKSIRSPQGEEVYQMSPEVLQTVEISERSLNAVKRSLEAVVNERHGTGWATHFDELKVAGKTGTAQVVKRKDDDEEDEAGRIPYRFRDHALFVAYAPAEDPRIAVAVVVEHGEHGGSAAAPIARDIFASYFGLEIGPLRPDDVVNVGD
ncbi:MAG: penicillin-binding protein 2 [Desulfuromonas sp.]|nr:MAG: penicillin-binding protein 2 [Desulfuromonas sp.]